MYLIGIAIEIRLAGGHKHVEGLFWPENFRKFPVPRDRFCSTASATTQSSETRN
jgi:hypothetical protein